MFVLKLYYIRDTNGWLNIFFPVHRCHCACREREEHCDIERHFYDSSECRCRCRNPSERTECIAGGKEWDDRSCSCACPRSTWRQCSTGYTFDYVNTCNCVSTYLIAASGSLTGWIIFIYFWIYVLIPSKYRSELL